MDQKYWLYVAGTTDNYTWWSSAPSITPTGEATYGAYRYTSNSGSSWGSSSTLNSFKITGTVVVPEPSTLILSGLSAAALAAKAFYRRRKATRLLSGIRE